MVARAGDRLRLSADHTVVAIAGATGSGKSSTFNALTGLEISAVGVRRPTTSWTTACVWGEAGAEELLEWLGIPPRHRVVRDSMLETGREDKAMQGVVLLDLPDHDSTEVSHHLEVDRLVQLADMLVWVLDPQKYADAAVHDRYLAPLETHKDVMLVVLNHIDTVPEGRRDAMLADVRRLLVLDGLETVPVLGISAREKIGVDTLRTEIVKRVADKKMARTRLAADLRAVAQDFAQQSGTAAPGQLSKERVAALDDALADAAGVPTVVGAVEKSTRMRANRATGWPVVAVALQAPTRPAQAAPPRPRLGRQGAERHRPDLRSCRHPGPAGPRGHRGARRGRRGLGRPHPSVGHGRAHRLGVAAARPRGPARRRAGRDRPRRATAPRVGRAGARAAVAADPVRPGGAVWLAALAVMAYLQLPEPTTPEVWGIPVPTLMLVGGVLVGVLLALLCRLLVSLTARRRARTVDRRLRTAISTVSDELVVAPIQVELAAYARFRAGLKTALG